MRTTFATTTASVPTHVTVELVIQALGVVAVIAAPIAAFLISNWILKEYRKEQQEHRKAQRRREQQQVLHGVFEMAHRVHLFGANNPRLAMIVYNDAGAPDPQALSHEDRRRLSHYFEMILDFYEYIHHQSDSLPPEDLDAYHRFMAGIYDGCRPFRQFVASHGLVWWSEAVIKDILRQSQHRDAKGVQMPLASTPGGQEAVALLRTHAALLPVDGSVRQCASDSEIQKVSEFDTLVYGDDNIQLEHLRRWCTHYPDGALINFKEDGEIAGVLGIWPISPQTCDGIVDGTCPESDVELAPRLKECVSNWYIAGVALPADRRDTGYIGAMLVHGFHRWLVTAEATFPMRLCAYAINQDGERLLRHLGFIDGVPAAGRPRAAEFPSLVRHFKDSQALKKFAEDIIEFANRARQSAQQRHASKK